MKEMIGTRMNADFQDYTGIHAVSAAMRGKNGSTANSRRGGSRTAPTPTWQNEHFLLTNILALIER
jgi:hypothetical protein